jgi:calcineurin-like phosphoesterase family protein
MEQYTEVFDEVYSGPLLISEHLMLSHEPVYNLPWLFELHGHLHSKNKNPREGENHANLAANVWGYHPAKLSGFLDQMVEKDFPSVHVCLKDQ